jgi:competence protein ComGC
VAADWFYEVDGEERGPVDFDELRRLCRADKVHPDDLVWSDGLDDWTPARKVEGLLTRRERAHAAPRREEHQPSGSTPGIVIAGFICSFLCPLLGIILCGIGLGEAKRNRSGAGLAVAGIVIGGLLTVLPILAAVAMPMLISGKVRARARETSAVVVLRMIHGAQQQFRDHDLDHDQLADYAPTLEELVSTGVIESVDSAAVHGYRLDLTVSDGGFECRATPVEEPGEATHLFIDESGVVRSERGRRAGPSSPVHSSSGAATRTSSDWDD